ncbi:uncharacterized protein LOC123873021 isoform X3 [Maniola jurtina]|uniref:uncharacterized protein LOC123873021 isoform X3 n=1 Tax=Maniola jurtina TaxID=191418 RepID=UPI001E68C009|nr:uncharacterized protein LOC123873021 isoform X3 [Maniola jurtina]
MSDYDVQCTSLASDDESDISLSTSHGSHEASPYVLRESPVDSHESHSEILPELIIEVEKKFSHDVPKEVYEKLEKSMVKLYIKHILNIDDDTISVDSIMERYYEAEANCDDGINIERSVEEELERLDIQDTDDGNDDSENKTDEEENSNASPEKDAERDVTLTYDFPRSPGLSPIPEVTEYFSRSSSHESLKGRETASQSYSHVTEGIVEVSINGSTRDGASDSLEKTKDVSKESHEIATPEAMRRCPRSRLTDIIPIRRRIIYEDLLEFTPPSQAWALPHTSFENTSGREDTPVAPNEDEDAPISPCEDREVSPCFPITGRAKTTSYNLIEDRQDTDRGNDDAENRTGEKANSDALPETEDERDVTYRYTGRAKATSYNPIEDRQDTDGGNDDAENRTDAEENRNVLPVIEVERDVIYRFAKIPGLSPIPEVSEHFSQISSYEGQKGRKTALRTYLRMTEGDVEVSINGSTQAERRASDDLAKTTDASQESEVTATPEAMRRRRSSKQTEISSIKRTSDENLHELTSPSKALRMSLIESAQESVSFENTTSREDAPISPNDNEDIPISPCEDQAVSPCFPITGRAKAISFNPIEDRKDTDCENDDAENGTHEKEKTDALPETEVERDDIYRFARIPDIQDTDDGNDDSENKTDEEENSNASPEKDAERDVTLTYDFPRSPGLSPIPEVTEYFSRSSSHESLKGRETASQSYSHVTEGVVEVSINGSTRDGASDSLAKTKGLSPISEVSEHFSRMFSREGQKSRETAPRTYLRETEEDVEVSINDSTQAERRASDNLAKTTDASPESDKTATPEAMRRQRSSTLTEISPKRRTIQRTLVETSKESVSSENTTGREDVPISLCEDREVSPCFPVTGRAKSTPYLTESKQDASKASSDAQTPEVVRRRRSFKVTDIIAVKKTKYDDLHHFTPPTPRDSRTIHAESIEEDTFEFTADPDDPFSPYKSRRSVSHSPYKGRPVPPTRVSRPVNLENNQDDPFIFTADPDDPFSPYKSRRSVSHSPYKGRPVPPTRVSRPVNLENNQDDPFIFTTDPDDPFSPYKSRRSVSHSPYKGRPPTRVSRPVNLESNQDDPFIFTTDPDDPFSRYKSRRSVSHSPYKGRPPTRVSRPVNLESNQDDPFILTADPDRPFSPYKSRCSVSHSPYKGRSGVPVSRSEGRDVPSSSNVGGDISGRDVRREISRPTFTPIASTSSTSSPRENPLPELIIEVEKKHVNDESEEFYKDLERMMVKVYLKYILEDDDIDSDDSDVQKYNSLI